jgi:hypothetical protein
MSVYRIRDLPASAAAWSGRPLQALVEALHDADETPVDLERVVQSLELTVEVRRMEPSVWGLTRSSSMVMVNRALPHTRRRFALAHEVGHVLVRRRLARVGGPVDEERFCDHFACELLAPARTVAAWEGSINDLSDLLQVDEVVIRNQQALVGLIAAVTTADGETACRDCGPYRAVSRCCRGARSGRAA